MQVKKQQLEPDMEQQTGSKLGKEYVKALCCHPAYLTCMQSTSCEILGWMKHKLQSRLPGEISLTSDMQKTPLSWQKMKRILFSWAPKSLWMVTEAMKLKGPCSLEEKLDKLRQHIQ